MKYIPTLLCDFYKISHREMYPKGTETIYSTWIPRASRFNYVDEVVAFGFQQFLIKMNEIFEREFFSLPKEKVVAEYARTIKYTLGVENPDTSHIEALHDLGYLPIHIKALDEGTLVPLRVPMLTIENTLPEFFWVTNYIESYASCELWQATTSATLAHEFRKVLDKYALLTVGNTDFVQFQGHDFAMRGMSSLDSAITSGMGHLLSFVGTDTIPAINAAEYYYGANIEEELIGTSIAASEHSIQCTYENDYEYLRSLLEDVHPNGFVSIVSDGYDFWDVIGRVLPALKSKIMARSGGPVGDRVVIRPDCYSDDTEILTNNGWKFFNNLNEDDLVAQVNPKDGLAEFVKPSRIIKQRYVGDMISFTSKTNPVDLLVTPNHRMARLSHKQKIRSVFDFKPDTIETVEAEDVVYCYQRDMVLSSQFKALGKGLTPLDKLKIAYQADGSLNSRWNNPTTNSIRFNFAKKRKTERLIQILDEGEFKYSVSNEPARPKNTSIHVWIDEPLSKDFEWIDIATVSSNWCQEFIEELSYWDAPRRTDFRFKFDTINPLVAEKVHIIAVMAGFRTKRSVSQDSRSELFSDVHTLHILTNTCLGGGRSVVKETVSYDGYVHCVTVPTGLVLVRRNGCTAVSGNSGDPVLIVCGDPKAPVGSLEYKGTVEALWDLFGGVISEQGYKVLDSHIGVIYGDAISIGRCREICERLEKKGFASINCVYGIGSYTYQYNTRDTFGFALKSTLAVIRRTVTEEEALSRWLADGWLEQDFEEKGFAYRAGTLAVEKQIFKDPKTDDGVKKSMKGKVMVFDSVFNKNGTIWAQDGYNLKAESPWDLLHTIYLNGRLTREQTLSQIREKLNGKT